MYQRRNGRQLIMVGIGIMLLVLVGGFLLSRGGGSKSVAAPQMVPVVVALQAIPQGTNFTVGEPLTQFFGVKPVPRSIVPFGAYTSVDQIANLTRSLGCQPATAAGCRGQLTVTQTIYQNLPVVSGMFSTLGQYRTSAGPAFQVPYGYVAISVSFSAVNSVLNSINAGDDIDLVASLTADENPGKTKPPPQTQYVMNDLRVIAVNGPPPPPAGTGTGAPGSTQAAPASTAAGGGGQLTLLVRYQQALIIQHLKDFGGSWQISAFLRSAKETDIPHFKTVPVTGKWFFVKQSNHFDSKEPY